MPRKPKHRIAKKPDKHPGTEYGKPIWDDVEKKVTETHRYKDADGNEGTIVYEYRKQGDKMQRRATHTGTGSGKDNYDWMNIEDDVISVDRVVSTTPVQLNVVKNVETVPGSGVYDKQVVVQETHNQPTYGKQNVTIKHPHKAQYFAM